MSKKTKKHGKRPKTVFEVGKRYLIEGLGGALEEVTISEVAGDDQCFNSGPMKYISQDAYWRRSNDFRIVAELPLKKEGAE